MLVRPLINRELLRECRRKMHFVARTVFVLALASYVTWRWMEIGAYSRQNVQTMMARYGNSLFIAWAVVQYIVIWALSAVRAAGLADERRIGSLQLMRSTALLDSGVIIGWFLSVMGRALFSMLLALPVLVMSRSFGGFTMSQVWMVLLITIVSATASAAFTLYIAAMSNSTGNALISSIVVQALVLVAIRYIGFRIVRSPSGMIGGLTLLGLSIQDLRFSISFMPMFLGSRLLLALLCLFLAIRRLKRPVARFGRPVKRLLMAADRFFLRFSNHKWVLWRSGLGECKRNPVMWREKAVSVLGQRDHVIRIWYTPVIVLIAIALLALAFSGEELAIFCLGVGLAGIPMVLTALFLIVPPAMAFVRERQQQTLGLLAATPLSARDIVMGKYLFCLRRFTVPLALGVVCVIMVILANPYWRDIDEMIPLFLLPALVPLFLAEMLYVTEGARSTAKAIAAAAVTLAAVALLANPELVEGGWYGGDFMWSAKTLYLPAITFLVAVTLLIQQMRIMRNGLFLGGIVILLFWATAAAHHYVGSEGEGALRFVIWLFCGLVLFSAVILARRKWSATWVGYALIMVLMSTAIPGGREGLGLPSLSIALLVVLLRAMRYAGPGVVNRAVLTIMVHWLVFGWLFVLGAGIPLVWVLALPVIALMIRVFLRMSILQLDALMGRNG